MPGAQVLRTADARLAGGLADKSCSSDNLIVYKFGQPRLCSPTMPDESNHADQSCGELSCDECNARTAALIAERDQLLAWKDSALELEREWDQQALAKMLGGTLGHSCRRIISEKVPLLIAERNQLRAEADDVRQAAKSNGDKLIALAKELDAERLRDRTFSYDTGGGYTRSMTAPHVERELEALHARATFAEAEVERLHHAAGYRPGLTADEKQVLEHLAAAWNKFLSLDTRRVDSTDAFRLAVHDAQRVIATRVASRVNPEIWNG